MRGQLLISIFLGVIGAGMSYSLMDSLLPHTKECISDVSRGGLIGLISGYPINKNDFIRLNCCLWTKAGFLKGAKFDLPMLEEIIMGGDDSKKEPKLVNALKECKSESEVSDDACIVFDHYYTCFNAKLSG